MNRHCHYDRTGYGYHIEFRENNMVVKERVIVGRKEKDMQRVKELVDEWTDHDWDIKWFDKNHGDLGV